MGYLIVAPVEEQVQQSSQDYSFFLSETDKAILWWKYRFPVLNFNAVKSRGVALLWGFAAKGFIATWICKEQVQAAAAKGGAGPTSF